MIPWLDAQISPSLCLWIARRFGVDAVHVRGLGLRGAEDTEIFDRARKAQAVVFTKDEDFVDLVRRLGSPPQVLWLRCGNMPNSRLKTILARTLPDAIELLREGEPIVEIGQTGKLADERRRTKASSRRRGTTRRRLMR